VVAMAVEKKLSIRLEINETKLLKTGIQTPYQFLLRIQILESRDKN
jgi:hypothetical protein